MRRPRRCPDFWLGPDFWLARGQHMERYDLNGRRLERREPTGEAVGTWVEDAMHQRLIVARGADVVAPREGREPLVLSGHGESIAAMDLAPGAELLATGSREEGRLVLWELPSGRQRHALEAHDDDINDLAFDPEGHLLATASADLTVKI